MSLRTKETEDRYGEHKKTPEFKNCPLCRIPSIEEFTYWRLVNNEFPYDKIADQHDMVVSKRHVNEKELTQEEEEELRLIRKDFMQRPTYSYLLEATHPTKTIPAHAHWHLIHVKDD